MSNTVAVAQEAPTPVSAEGAPEVGANQDGFSAATISATDPSTKGFQHVRVDAIVPNPRQPRQHFDATSLEQLAGSIKQSGVMQPIVVRPIPGGFELVAGERRFRACQSIGRDTIPAVVKSLSDRDAAEWALVENLQREDLGPIERANGIARLMEEFGITQADAGKQLALDRSTVTNLLRLRDLDQSTMDALEAGLIAQGHARALLGCRELNRRHELLKACVRKGWSVREVERQVKQAGTTRSDPGSPRSSHVTDMEVRLGAHLGTKVKIALGRKKGTGRMTLDFYSLEQFDGLLEKLGFNPENGI